MKDSVGGVYGGYDRVCKGGGVWQDRGGQEGNIRQEKDKIITRLRRVACSPATPLFIVPYPASFPSTTHCPSFNLYINIVFAFTTDYRMHFYFYLSSWLQLVYWDFYLTLAVRVEISFGGEIGPCRELRGRERAGGANNGSVVLVLSARTHAGLGWLVGGLTNWLAGWLGFCAPYPCNNPPFILILEARFP